MRTLFTLMLTSFITIATFAQQGINYKAVVKDDIGNIVSNQSITIQLAVLEGTGLTNVYTESHNPTTDSNGLIIVNIGEGTPISGSYNTVAWAGDEHHLNVQVDIGAGLVDMGTTQFMAVPYAKQAENVDKMALISASGTIYNINLNDDFIIGSVQLNDDPGISTDNAKFFFDKSKYAFRAGNVPGTRWDALNVGEGSVAFGFNSQASGFSSLAANSATTASGDYTTAMGSNTTASGTYASSFGIDTQASGESSNAMGTGSIASGENSFSTGFQTYASGNESVALGSESWAIANISTAMGQGTLAEAYSSLVAGRFNVGGGDPTVWDDNDPLFEIGNGASDAARSNALTVLKNGTITAPSFDLAEITDTKALVTKEYVDVNASTGLEALTEGFNPGWRIIGRDPLNHGPVGDSAIDLSASDLPSETNGATGAVSFATGFRTSASAIASTAMGIGSLASGSNSMAMGSNSIASGITSTAMGSNTSASGDFSTAMGSNSTAVGNFSVAMGFNTTASGESSVALGLFTNASGEASTAMGASTTASGDIAAALGFAANAPSFAETVLGSYNTLYTPLSITSFNPSDRLFVIGNGTSDVARSNAVTVLKNGNVGIGNATPVHFLDVNGRMRVTNGTTGTAGIWFSDGTVDRQFAGVNTHTATGSNQKWGVFNNNAWNFIVQGNGQVGIANTNPNVALDVIGSIEYTGTITDVSDKRLKENFAPIENALKRITKLDGYAYNMKGDATKKIEYGLIAQELKKVFPEMVSVVDKEKGFLGVSYIQLIPVLINAIKEQDLIIKSQNAKIESQASATTKQVELIESMMQRITALETHTNQ